MVFNECLVVFNQFLLVMFYWKALADTHKTLLMKLMKYLLMSMKNLLPLVLRVLVTYILMYGQVVYLVFKMLFAFGSIHVCYYNVDAQLLIVEITV